MNNYTLGIFLSLLSSFCWAAAVIFFRKGGRSLSSFSLNVGKSIVGLVLFSITLPILGIPFFPSIPHKESLLIMVSGVVGIGFGDLLFLKSLNLLGAGLNSIAGSVYTPLLVFGAIVFLGESISLPLILGAVLVVSAVILIATESIKTRPEKLFQGLIIGASGMIFTVIGVLLMKDLLVKLNIFWVNWVRIISAMGFYGIYFLFRKDKKQIVHSLSQGKNWIILGLGGFLGTYVAILAWTWSFALLPASIVAVINQLTIVVIIFFAWLFLKEPITMRKAIAALMACSGAFLAAS
jgi:drug/metabolite transporter (DMT)-like permease